MAKQKEVKPLNVGEFPKPKTMDARDNQMIALAYDLVEQRMREGTATSQETTYFLKYAAMREKAELELDILREQRKLLEAKTENLQMAKRNEELLEKAMSAFASYRSTADYHED